MLPYVVRPVWIPPSYPPYYPYPFVPYPTTSGGTSVSPLTVGISYSTCGEFPGSSSSFTATA
jgi:hypothetical protein